MAEPLHRGIAALLRRAPADWLLAAGALVALARARQRLARRRFADVAADWGRFVPAATGSRPAPEIEPVAAQARAIGWAVRGAARFAPFKALCLQQAVAAQAMLARRGIGSVLHYGVGRDEDGALVAHAWIEAAGVALTGYPVPPGIVHVGAFVRENGTIPQPVEEAIADQ